MGDDRIPFHDFLPETKRRALREFGMDLDARKSLDLKTEVDGWTVSTVKLVCDHGWDGRPVWHETMIYRDSDASPLGSEFQDYQARYFSEEEARVGHAEVVRKLSKGEALDDG